MHVHDVEVAVTQGPPCGDGALRKRPEIGDGSIGSEPDRPADVHQVVGAFAILRRGTVERLREAIGWIEGRENTHVVPTAEKLLRKRLDVAVHASLIRPGIWRNECDAHCRTGYLPGRPPPWALPPSAQQNPTKARM